MLGASTREALDAPSLSINGIFQKIALDFNNVDKHIDMPENACDIHGIDFIDANDGSRISMNRDCEGILFLIFISFTLIRYVI